MSENQLEQIAEQEVGRLTGAMRAAVGTGPKLLRVATVRAGRVLQERIVERPTSISIGPGPEHTLCLDSASLGSEYCLFECVAGHYVLNVADAMHGSVAMDARVFEMSELPEQVTCASKGIRKLRLADDARGKLSFGDVTLLFQFVPPRPHPVAVAHQVARRSHSVDFDSTTTLVAAFSFLLHFLAIGSLYSDWMDPIVNDDMMVASLVDTLKSLPALPPAEQRMEPGERQDAKANPAPSISKANRGKASSRAAPGSHGTNQAAARLAQVLDSVGAYTLSALRSTGPATDNVLNSGRISFGNLDDLAARNAGIGSLEKLGLQGGDGRLRSDPAVSGLETVGNRGADSHSERGARQNVAGPSGNARIAAPTVAGGAVTNAANVIAQLKGPFRSCYSRELANNPDAAGTVRLTLTLGPGGEVQNVAAASAGSLGSAVACVTNRASRAQFEPPQGGSAVIVVPVTFVKQ